MKLLFCIILTTTIIACTGGSQSPNTKMSFPKIPITYPFSRQDTAVHDTYFGQTIGDPYRWLEDDQSPETKDWVAKQNIVTTGYLGQIPYRDQIRHRVEQIFNFEKYTTPFKEGGKYYFFKNDGLQNQNVLYVQDDLNAAPRLVLDPNTFSTDGTASLGEYDFSQDGRYLAYTISRGGSDWRTIVVKDLQTGEMLSDQLEWAKFTTLGWLGDGFHYTRYPTPKKGDELKAANQLSAVWFHRLGSPQSADRLVYNDPQHANRMFSGFTTEDQRFLCITGSESTSGNTLYFKDLAQEQTAFTPVVTTFEQDFAVVDNIGEKLLVLTNKNAPNQRLLLVSAGHPEEANWETIIPEDSSDVLQSAVLCGGKIVCSYLHQASSALRVYDLQGKLLKAVQLPEIGTVGNVSGKQQESLAFFSFTSFLRPTTIYSLDMNTLETKVFKAPKTEFNPEAYTTEQVWYSSKDGTPVPMFVTRKKDLAFNGANPTLLYGYGGFNISITPAFTASKAVLLENGGVYVVANIRGGGEFGEKWHLAGT
ncbi:MAG: prolyl oligopeptidase family serine peptidase, partial [Saprospiraceae bacterium]